MTAIQQVKTAVVNAIKAAGVTALTAYSAEELKNTPARWRRSACAR